MSYLVFFLVLGTLATASPRPVSRLDYSAPGRARLCTLPYMQEPCEFMATYYAPDKPMCLSTSTPPYLRSIQPNPYTLCRMYTDTACTYEAGRTMWPGNASTLEDLGVIVLSIACVAHYGDSDDPAWPIDVPQPFPTGVCVGPNDFTCYGPGVTGIPESAANQSTIINTTLKTYSNTVMPTGVNSDTSLETGPMFTPTPLYPLSNSTSLCGPALSTGTSVPTS